MRLRKLTSALLAAALAATAITTSQIVYAANFTSATDFLNDVVDVALADVESSTKADAIAATNAKLAVTENTITFDGRTIGYWFADDSTTLWKDEAQTEKLFEKSATGYDVDPDLLKTLLSDVNEGIVDTYIPNTSDWSKVIGRYDVTLGDITIPANQWVPCDIASTNSPIASNEVVNLSAISGISGDNITARWDATNPYIMSYIVDSSGRLWVQDLCTQLYQCTYWDADAYTVGGTHVSLPVTSPSVSSQPLIKVGLDASNSNLRIGVYVTNATNDKFSGLGSAAFYKLLSINDAGEAFSGNFSAAKSIGFLYFTGAQAPAITDDTSFKKSLANMFTSNSASRTVAKSALLSKRLAKLSSLAETDVLTVSESGWFVNNTTDLDTFLGTQTIAMAGDTADIDAVAEIEPLHFNVVVPTTLPIHVATDGTVTVATNATIENKSNAAVRITDLNIDAKPESGWTLVADNPSDIRDAKQFTFETSLAVNMVLDKGEAKPFTYAAKLSPMTAGSDSLDLATVSVTVDWAD